jgi:L-2-hydroxyglutarate oxidase LhgO
MSFAGNNHVPHRQCGKLLVAVSEAESDKLSAIKAQAEANDVMDLVWLSGDEARALKPALAVHRALLSPSTGIIDSHALMHALCGGRRTVWRSRRLFFPVGSTTSAS